MDDIREKLQQVIVDLLTDGHEVEVPVFGISMFPFFLPGTIVNVVRAQVEEVRKGDVIFFKNKEKLVLHRVVRKGDGWLQCKGDSLLKLDPVIVKEQFVAMVKGWKYKGSLHDVNSFSFRLYASTMVLLCPITGVCLWPLALLWNKYWGHSPFKI